MKLLDLCKEIERLLAEKMDGLKRVSPDGQENQLLKSWMCLKSLRNSELKSRNITWLVHILVPARITLHKDRAVDW